VLANGVPSRFPIQLQEVLAYEHYDFKTDAYNPGCWLAYDEPTENLLPVCIQSKAADKIFVWGDSYAARLSPGLRKVFGADRVSQITKNSCPPLVGLGAPASRTCRNGNDVFFNLIRDNHPTTVVLFGAWMNYDPNWRADSPYGSLLAQTIGKLKSIGVPNIVVIGASPRFGPELPALLFHSWNMGEWSSIPERVLVDIVDLGALRSLDSDLEHIATSEGARFLSLLKLFCDKAYCLAKVPGSQSDLVTWDSAHLTTPAAAMVARALGEGAPSN
jgi:hypothetical protein